MPPLTAERLYGLLDEVPVHPRKRLEYLSGRGHVFLAGREPHPQDRGKTVLAVRRSGREISLSYERIFGLIREIRADAPVHMDTFLRAAGNDRTVIAVLLLQTREFRHAREGGRSVIVWCPGQPHAAGAPAAWRAAGAAAVCGAPGRDSVVRAVAHVMRGGIFDWQTVADVAVGLRSRHVAISGPPGSGKNHLVRLLGEAFGVDFVLATASEEWSSHSLMGQVALAAGETRYVPGHFVSAVDRCAAAGGARPVWLLIDECNRCRIDRVFGQLFTILGDGNGTGQSMFVPENDPHGAPHVIPPWFRVIMCFNEFDADFIEGMSSALRRRFNSYRLSLPPNGADGLSSLREWQFVVSGAPQRAQLAGDEAEAAAAALAAAADTVRSAAGLVRQRLAVMGTAQMFNWCSDFCARAHVFPGEPWRAQLDRAALATVVGELESDSVHMHIQRLQRRTSGVDIRGMAGEMERIGLPLAAARIAALAE